MCLPRMGSPSVFAAILDRGAGRFRLGPADATVPAGFTGPHTVGDGGQRTWTADRIILTVGGHACRRPARGGRRVLRGRLARQRQSARMEGRIAATNAVLGATRQASYDVVPSGSFTDPEYGRVGLTEAEAAAHHDPVVGLARYDDLLRPVADGRPEGFCKLIAVRRVRNRSTEESERRPVRGWASPTTAVPGRRPPFPGC